ncbi:hypothetical protein AB0C71_21515 [Streptomyces anulatus]|uniref:hypothetical protein n=1 Tax=Streptomyces anulatus TaxID=1892 RepID=UPI0033CD620D
MSRPCRIAPPGSCAISRTAPVTAEATARRRACWSGSSHPASASTTGTAARVLIVAASTPPVPSTARPSGAMQSHSSGSREPNAVSIAAGSSPASQAPTGTGSGGGGSERTHAAARRPAAPAAASTRAWPSHVSYGGASSMGPAGTGKGKSVMTR